MNKTIEAKKMIEQMNKQYLKSPSMVQMMLSENGIYLSLIDVKKLIGSV